MTDEPGHEESVSGNSGQFSPASLDIADNCAKKKMQEKLIVCRAIHHKPPGISWQFSF